MTTANTENKYFDLHTSGIGYLNRIREVQVKKGQPFWACTVGALHGSQDDAEYTYFDCRVSGTEAENLVKRCVPAVEAGKKVLVGFKIGDIYTETYVIQKGDRKGETGVSLKGRLLCISWIKVNGEMVYQAPKKEESSEATADEVPVETPAAAEVSEVPAKVAMEEVAEAASF